MILRMTISVIIPTRPDDDRVVSRCVAPLLEQVHDGDEVIVSVDGPVCPGRFENTGAGTVMGGPVAGPGAARNRGLRAATGAVVLFLNDDVVAEPGLLDAHRRAHAGPDRARMVLGSAPWHIPDDDRVIDRLLRETSMIFFYDRMGGSIADHDWGFRHAWTLNLSLPRSIALPYDTALSKPMFDDLEWAFRVHQRYGAPVLYRPEACVVHHHRYTPEQVFRREVVLGHQIRALTVANPACAAAVFGDRFPIGPAHGAGCTPDLKGSAGEASAAFERFEAVCGQPADSITGGALGELYDGSRVWRDWARRGGFAAACAGARCDEAATDLTEQLRAGSARPA